MKVTKSDIRSAIEYYENIKSFEDRMKLQEEFENDMKTKPGVYNREDTLYK